MHRWRGEVDVPLTLEGLGNVFMLRQLLDLKGGLTLCYHDHLSRDRDTAEALCSITAEEKRGLRPWRMGPNFEGQPITPGSIVASMWLVRHPDIRPFGGEPFQEWYDEWLDWLSRVPQHHRIGVVTHNRNIQAIYATRHGVLDSREYNNPGPRPCTVHYYKDHKIEPWDEREMQQGVYLIRHGDTAWGT